MLMEAKDSKSTKVDLITKSLQFTYELPEYFFFLIGIKYNYQQSYLSSYLFLSRSYQIWHNFFHYKTRYFMKKFY